MIEDFNIIKGLIIKQYNAFYLQFLLTDSLTVEIFSHRSMENVTLEQMSQSGKCNESSSTCTNLYMHASLNIVKINSPYLNT